MANPPARVKLALRPRISCLLYGGYIGTNIGVYRGSIGGLYRGYRNIGVYRVLLAWVRV